MVSSPAFADGETLPSRFTNDGEGLSPPLAFTEVPDGTVSLALVIEDADSPTPAPLCHALVWNIGPEARELAASALNANAQLTERHGARVGKNSFMSLGWLPPDPPTGHGPHRYVFQVYALKIRPSLDEGAGRNALLDAMRSHVLAKGYLVGIYERGT